MRDLGALQRDLALDRLDDSHEAWITVATRIIKHVAAQKQELTSDDIWPHIPPAAEPRAMGAAFRRAAKDGVIMATDRVKSSIRPACHRRPIRVWRSLL